jgi:hypothetical protein
VTHLSWCESKAHALLEDRLVDKARIRASEHFQFTDCLSGVQPACRVLGKGSGEKRSLDLLRHTNNVGRNKKIEMDVV